MENARASSVRNSPNNVGVVSVGQRTDIAADRAGTRFGALATASPQEARRVQAFVARGISETDIMPRARDLPEHMNAAEFQRRYGGVGSPAYQAVMDDIERRIDACTIHRR